MKDLLNCPNCGAPIQDDICPYCGSVFLDWAAFDLQRPTFVKVRDYQGRILLMKLTTPSIRITIDQGDAGYFYADNVRIPYRNAFPDATIDAEFKVEPFDDHISGETVLYISIDPEKADKETVSDILKGVKKKRMTPMMLYEIFKRTFPEYIPHVIRYKGSKKNGGIDIQMDDGSVLNFQTNKENGWILKKGG